MNFPNRDPILLGDNPPRLLVVTPFTSVAFIVAVCSYMVADLYWDRSQDTRLTALEQRPTPVCRCDQTQPKAEPKPLPEPPAVQPEPDKKPEAEPEAEKPQSKRKNKRNKESK